MALRLVPSAVPDVARVEWEPQPVQLRADDVMGSPSECGKRRLQQAAAETWVREKLAKGPVPVGKLKKMTQDEKMHWQSIYKASLRLGVKKSQPRKGVKVVWSLREAK